MLKRAMLIILLIFLSTRSKADPSKSEEVSPSVPGIVIDYQPAETGRYVGSPSIVILSNGDYVASHDIFGPGTIMNNMGETKVFRSEDKGMSWQKVAHLYGQFWSTLFIHRDTLYIFGTYQCYGPVVIRRSTDGGRTWTKPEDKETGLLRHGNYHTAPVPIAVHNEKIWRAVEEKKFLKGPWGRSFRAGIMSAPLDSDLLKAKNWTLSNFLRSDQEWLDGMFRAWLEGNVVVTPKGQLVNILRVNYNRDQWKDEPVRAAVVQISEDGKKISFNPENVFIEMPGGNAKFTIRYDEVSGRYWSLVNKMELGKYARNKLALISSTNLRDWEIKEIVLEHPYTGHHGFQYVDFQFEEDDIIAASRTGWTGSNSTHDANYFTFHRIENFRGK